MKLTLQIQLLPDKQQAHQLLSTMERFNKARREMVERCLAGKSARDAVQQFLRDAVNRFTDPEHGNCFVTQAPIAPDAASAETRDLMAKRRAEVSAPGFGIARTAHSIDFNSSGDRQPAPA